MQQRMWQDFQFKVRVWFSWLCLVSFSKDGGTEPRTRTSQEAYSRNRFRSRLSFERIWLVRYIAERTNRSFERTDSWGGKEKLRIEALKRSEDEGI